MPFTTPSPLTSPRWEAPANYAPSGNNGNDHKVFGAPADPEEGEASPARYVSMADGSLLVFNGEANNCSKGIGTSTSAYAAANTSCTGFIDVNGTTLPNREVACGGEVATAIADGTCEVPNDANHMTDIYPVVFHDATVEPLTNAARYVLTTSK